MKAKPGEIWLADLGLAAKVRPVLVVSRHDPDAPRALTIYLPLTTQHRGSDTKCLWDHSSFSTKNRSSTFRVWGAKVKEALRFALDL